MSYKDMKSSINKKLRVIYSENQKLESENANLSKEIQQLTASLREMVPGFSNDTSNPFPLYTELQNKLNDYIKITCQDIFFDFLQPKLNMKFTVKFFKNILQKISDIIRSYFSPVESQLQKTLLQRRIPKAINNVLKKSYQYKYKEISNQIRKMINIDNLINTVGKEINFNFDENDEDDYYKMVEIFIEKTFEIIFLCQISDPQIVVDLNQIGNEVKYNSIVQDSMDGFIKQKQSVIVIIPMFYKGAEKGKDTGITKSQVLEKNYYFPESN